MRTFVLDGMKDAANIEKGDVNSAQHDTFALPGRKFVHTKGFHRGILGGSAPFPGKRAGRLRDAAQKAVLVTVVPYSAVAAIPTAQASP